MSPTFSYDSENGEGRLSFYGQDDSQFLMDKSSGAMLQRLRNSAAVYTNSRLGYSLAFSGRSMTVGEDDRYIYFEVRDCVGPVRLNTTDPNEILDQLGSLSEEVRPRVSAPRRTQRTVRQGGW